MPHHHCSQVICHIITLNPLYPNSIWRESLCLEIQWWHPIFPSIGIHLFPPICSYIHLFIHSFSKCLPSLLSGRSPARYWECRQEWDTLYPWGRHMAWEANTRQAWTTQQRKPTSLVPPGFSPGPPNPFHSCYPSEFTPPSFPRHIVMEWMEETLPNTNLPCALYLSQAWHLEAMKQTSPQKWSHIYSLLLLPHSPLTKTQAA